MVETTILSSTSDFTAMSSVQCIIGLPQILRMFLPGQRARVCFCFDYAEMFSGFYFHLILVDGDVLIRKSAPVVKGALFWVTVVLLLLFFNGCPGCWDFIGGIYCCCSPWAVDYEFG